MNSSVHLTEDQIDDYLIGDLADERRSHLTTCVHCQARLSELEAPIASFKNVSLAWSERRSATLPVWPANAGPKTAPSLGAVGAAIAAMAVVVGVAVPLAHYEALKTEDQTTLHAPAVPAQTFTAERDEQIAQDNQMLQAIDRELGAPVSSPRETFGLELADSPQRSVPVGSVRD